MQLLLIGCDRTSTDFLADKLSNSGFRIESASSIEDVMRSGLAAHATAVILELSAVGERTVSIIARLRSTGVTQPLIVISPNCDWRSKVDCLDAGADDFLLKPVRSEEVAARVRALVRRVSGNPTDRIVAGELELDLKARCAWLSGKCLDLTKTEYRLLRLFLLSTERILTHGNIRDKLYPDGTECSLNAIEVQIARLRRKVGKDTIRTIRGVGYRFAGELTHAEDAVPGIEPCSATHCSCTCGNGHNKD